MDPLFAVALATALLTGLWPIQPLLCAWLQHFVRLRSVPQVVRDRSARAAEVAALRLKLHGISAVVRRPHSRLRTVAAAHRALPPPRTTLPTMPARSANLLRRKTSSWPSVSVALDYAFLLLLTVCS